MRSCNEGGGQRRAPLVSIRSVRDTSATIDRRVQVVAGTRRSVFAAFTAEGKAYVVMIGLGDAPTGHAYQAWYIVDGTPQPAGLMKPEL